MQRNVMSATIARRFGVSAKHTLSNSAGRAFWSTPGYHATTETTTASHKKPTHEQTLAFLQSEDGRLLDKLENRLLHLRDTVIRNRDLVSFPKTFQPEALLSIPQYTLGAQRKSAEEMTRVADTVLERIDYLQQHLDDLKREPYPTPGETTGRGMLEWERRIRRAPREVQEEELVGVDLEIKGIQARIKDSLQVLERVAEGFENSAARRRINLDILERPTAREKTGTETSTRQAASPVVRKETEVPFPLQEEEKKQADGSGESEAPERKPIEKKKRIFNSLREMQARLDKSFKSGR